MDVIKINPIVYSILTKSKLNSIQEKINKNKNIDSIIIIKDVVYSYYGLSYNDSLANSRKGEYNLCRQISMYFCRKYLALNS